MNGLVPRWFARAVVYSGGVLVIGAVAWVLIWLLLRIAALTFSLFVALLLAALLDPLTRRLRRFLPRWAAALLSLVALLAFLGGTGYLLTRRVVAQSDGLRASVRAGIDSIRDWLVTGPLALRPEQVDAVRAEILDGLRAVVPSGFSAATTVVYAVGYVVLALFVLFFLMKDGDTMWTWAVRLVPTRHRDRVDGAGHVAWDTAKRYVVGTLIVALVDAVGIGIGLVVIGVPLALSLTLLVFVGAFIPLLGATISGGVAVLVTLVTNGLVAALVVLGVVLVVQNVEGNLLQPLIQGRALRLHPVVILVVVTAGVLLFGIPGGVVAVPLAAMAAHVAGYLRGGVASPGHG